MDYLIAVPMEFLENVEHLINQVELRYSKYLNVEHIRDDLKVLLTEPDSNESMPDNMYVAICSYDTRPVQSINIIGTQDQISLLATICEAMCLGTLEHHDRVVWWHEPSVVERARFARQGQGGSETPPDTTPPPTP